MTAPQKPWLQENNINENRTSGILLSTSYNYPIKESSVTSTHYSPDIDSSHTFYEAKVQNEPYYYLDLHELNFPDRDERGCGLVNMTVHVRGGNYRHQIGSN
jgi:hypothetical protein